MSNIKRKPMRDLRGRTALITGASRGIGPHIAKALAKEQMHLILCARSQPALEKEAESLRQYGNRVEVLPADLTRREELESLARRACEVTGSVDVLVNNAGMVCFLPYHRLPPEAIEKENSLNVVAPMLLTRYLLPGMLKRGVGHIVNMSSVNAEIPMAYLASYGGTKAGVAGFTRSLRQELYGTGVSASVMIAGVVWNAGMLTDFESKSGFRTSKLAGGCTPEQIAAGVVRAIKHDKPEVIVNRPPIRPVLVLLRVMPRAMEALLRAIGVQKQIGIAAEMNVASGGKVTGVGISPDIEEQLARNDSPDQ